MPSGYKFNYTGPIIGATLPYGELWMWGYNNLGQLGNNSIVNRSSPVQTITGGTNWSSVVTSYTSSAAIKSDGTLWCWGKGTAGQLGDNTAITKSSPIQTVAGGTTWTSVAIGYNFAGGIKTDGTLWMWGNNASGQLGDNTIVSKSSPIQTITGGSTWSSVSCGYGHTAAIKTDGTLWTWGNQGYWAGARGGLGDNTLTNRSSPVQTVAGGTNWSKVSAGYGATSAIKTDGTLWVWGNNLAGMLGTNDTNHRSSPVQTVAGGTNWRLASITSNNAVALKTDNSLWVWGSNNVGQLGDNTTVNKSSPIQTGLNSTDWLDAWAGAAMIRALKSDGRIFTWGSAGGAGHIGNNANTNRSNPTQIVGSVAFKNVGEGSNSVHSGAIGNSFTTALVDLSDVYQEKQYFSDNLLWSWGNNDYGALGDGTVTYRSSPVQTFTGKQLSCGFQSTAAIKIDGTLWMWGFNYFGELGDNTTTNRSSPVQTVTGGTNWKQVSCGSSHTAAIKTDGTLWLWGSDQEGRLGDNTTTNRSSPVQTISGGTNWRQVECGGYYTAAIKTDGTLWTWGNNYYGMLGDNTTTNRSSPVQTVAGGTNWKQVSCGSLHTAAIKTDGTLWLWGENYFGGLGDNTTTNRSSPIQTISGGNNWSQVSCGSSHTAAIKTDGTLWLWGDNSYGKLGDNTTTNRSSPVQTVTGGTNWKQVECSLYGNTAAVKTDGTLWLWGQNEFGQLGDNTTTNRSSPVQTVTGGTNWKQVECGAFHTAAFAVVV